jgi:hypothetical protein
MTEQTPAAPVAAIPSVRRAVTVEASQTRAFDVFTRGFNTWWPREHHIGPGNLETAIIEPFAGGRWYEQLTGGVECEVGRVLLWEPPARLMLAWHITPQWKYEPDPDKASEIELRFIAEGPTRTRVELEHRHFERHGDGGDTMRSQVDSGWPGLLDLYARVAQESNA